MSTLHAAHDPLLLAAHAAGDASGADLARAAALVAGCPDCARLHRDLRALPLALASAPAPSRPRDFRLTAEQAESLRRPAGWRRLLAPLSGASSAAGPLAASLAALGLAGLLLGSGLSGALNLGVGSAGSAGTAAGPNVAQASVAASAEAALGPNGAAPSDKGPLPRPPFSGETPLPLPSGAPSVVVSSAPSAQTTNGTPAPSPLISRERATAIARAARPAYAKDQVFAAQLGTFADLGNAHAETASPTPAPTALVWLVNIGWQLGPLNGQGAIVLIDAQDGRVIQAFEWIS